MVRTVTRNTLLQSATKLLKHSTQVGQLQRTKEFTPLPQLLHSKLGCLLFSIGSSSSGTTLHGGDAMGEEKLYCPLWKSVKRQRAALGRSVSTNFVADCSWYKMHHSATWNYNMYPFQFPERPAIKCCKKKTFYSYKLIKPRRAVNIFGEIGTVTLSRRILGSLCKVVFEKRHLLTGCEASSQRASSFLCLESTLFVLLCVFTLKETIYLKH